MNEQLQSLSKIFTEKILRIPDYQRGYAWLDRNLQDFWNDLVILKEGDNHYAGVLTLDDVQDCDWEKWEDDQWIIKHKSYKPYHVVDGQQRLTTSLVLIECILEELREDGKLNYNTKDEIRKKFIFESKDGGISRSYLFGYERDNPSHNCLKIQIFNESSHDHHELESTIYTINLLRAKRFFKDKLRGLDEEETSKIYKKLTQNFLFNIYAISNEIDTFVSFETMNNRGKPLSHLELLKNRLIYLSTKMDAEQTEKEKLRRVINEAWKNIYHYLGKDNENLLKDDDFLYSHHILYFDHSVNAFKDDLAYTYSLRTLNERHKKFLLEELFTINNIVGYGGDLTIDYIFDYVSSLNESIQNWFKIMNPSQSNLNSKEKAWLKKIREYHPLASENTLLLSLYTLERSTEQRQLFLETLERQMFVTRMSHFEDYNSTNFLWAHAIFKKDVTVQDIITLMDKASSADGLSAFITSTMIQGYSTTSNGFYKWPLLKHFLLEYERDLKIKSRTDADKLDSEWLYDADMDSSIEHIYPQNPKSGEWSYGFEKISSREKGILKNTLGNLVAISRSKNSSLKNSSFDLKKDNKRGSGYRFGTYSEINLCNYENWGPEEIISRGLSMLRFMERRWKLKLGKTSDKLQILGMESIARKIEFNTKS